MTLSSAGLWFVNDSALFCLVFGFVVTGRILNHIKLIPLSPIPLLHGISPGTDSDLALTFFIAGDGSTTNIYYNDFWPVMPGNLNKTEPVYTNPDYIHHFNPNAKIIMSVRNPIDRWDVYTNI